jgi:hypothetical protein
VVEAQPHHRENNTLYHLEETGKELKLTAFPEKNIQPNTSIPAPRLALRVEGAGHYSQISSQDHFREPTYPNKLTLTTHPHPRPK